MAAFKFSSGKSAFKTQSKNFCIATKSPLLNLLLIALKTLSALEFSKAIK